MRVWRLITETFRIWEHANSSRMAAAMTYYTMLSLAPLLMIAVAIAGYVYDDSMAQREIVQQVGVLTTPEVAETVAGLIKNATQPTSGIFASASSLLVLFYGASGVFSQLYDTFNDIWQVPMQSRVGLRFNIQKRLIGVVMVLTAGVLLAGTLMLGSVISFLNQLVDDKFPQVATWLSLADRSLSFLLMPFVFATIFWFFPATKIKWRDVWPAGVLTAMMVAGSRYLIDYYLQFSTTSEVYGAAGSLVVLLVWVYITGMVVFFGASFSHAWADAFGSHSEHDPNSLALASDFVSIERTKIRSTEIENQLRVSPANSAAAPVGQPTIYPQHVSQRPLVLHRREPGSQNQPDRKFGQK